jgi:hypothetical protein
MSPIAQFNAAFGYHFGESATNAELLLMAEVAKLRGRKDIAERLLTLIKK